MVSYVKLCFKLNFLSFFFFEWFLRFFSHLTDGATGWFAASSRGSWSSDSPSLSGSDRSPSFCLWVKKVITAQGCIYKCLSVRQRAHSEGSLCDIFENCATLKKLCDNFKLLNISIWSIWLVTYIYQLKNKNRWSSIITNYTMIRNGPTQL